MQLITLPVKLIGLLGSLRTLPLKSSGITGVQVGPLIIT